MKFFNLFLMLLSIGFVNTVHAAEGHANCVVEDGVYPLVEMPEFQAEVVLQNHQSSSTVLKTAKGLSVSYALSPDRQDNSVLISISVSEYGVKQSFSASAKDKLKLRYDSTTGRKTITCELK